MNDDDDDTDVKHEDIHEFYSLGKVIGRYVFVPRGVFVFLAVAPCAVRVVAIAHVAPYVARSGGFSEVRDATEKATDKKYAIKCIKKTAVEGEDIKLLRREIKIMRKVDHPNILKLYEVYEDEDEFYLVMELYVLSLSLTPERMMVVIFFLTHTHMALRASNSVDGKELFEKIVEKGQYSEKDASRIVQQIVSAVQYLHEKGIAHRDLKVVFLFLFLFGAATHQSIAGERVAREPAFGRRRGERDHQDCRLWFLQELW